MQIFDVICVKVIITIQSINFIPKNYFVKGVSSHDVFKSSFSSVTELPGWLEDLKKKMNRNRSDAPIMIYFI